MCSFSIKCSFLSYTSITYNLFFYTYTVWLNQSKPLTFPTFFKLSKKLSTLDVFMKFTDTILFLNVEFVSCWFDFISDASSSIKRFKNNGAQRQNKCRYAKQGLHSYLLQGATHSPNLSLFVYL